MAGRPIGRRHQDDVRAKIQADRILAWLQAGIFGDEFQGKPVELTSEKVNAAKALLNKRLPDLSNIELGGDAENPIHTKATVEFVNAGSTTQGA